MASKYAPATVVIEIDPIIDTWTANPEFTLGPTKLIDVKALRDALVAADKLVETKRTELTALINTRDAKAAELASLVTRARSGFRAVYGPDSTQYEQAGGTRASERKPRKASARKVAAT